MRACLVFLLVMGCGTESRAETEPPSADLLEFLGEIDPVDEETWQILEHHALRDVPGPKEVSDE